MANANKVLANETRGMMSHVESLAEVEMMTTSPVFKDGRGEEGPSCQLGMMRRAD